MLGRGRVSLWVIEASWCVVEASWCIVEIVWIVELRLSVRMLSVDIEVSSRSPIFTIFPLGENDTQMCFELFSELCETCGMSSGLRPLRALVRAGDKTSGDTRSWYMISGDAKSWVLDCSAYIHYLGGVVGLATDVEDQQQHHHLQPFMCEIDRATRGKLGDKNADETWEIIESLALYDKEGWNDSKDLVKPAKVILTSLNTPRTLDRRLLELEDQINFLLKGPQPKSFTFWERISPYPQPQVLETTFEARVRDYMAAHTETMDRLSRAMRSAMSNANPNPLLRDRNSEPPTDSTIAKEHDNAAPRSPR
ncbi:hypothetical protein Tco_0209307 [Tanacetum coccineum]